MMESRTDSDLFTPLKVEMTESSWRIVVFLDRSLDFTYVNGFTSPIRAVPLRLSGTVSPRLAVNFLDKDGRLIVSASFEGGSA